MSRKYASSFPPSCRNLSLTKPAHDQPTSRKSSLHILDFNSGNRLFRQYCKFIDSIDSKSNYRMKKKHYLTAIGVVITILIFLFGDGLYFRHFSKPSIPITIPEKANTTPSPATTRPLTDKTSTPGNTTEDEHKLTKQTIDESEITVCTKIIIVGNTFPNSEYYRFRHLRDVIKDNCKRYPTKRSHIRDCILENASKFFPSSDHYTSSFLDLYQLCK